jgi:hypothetical protein
MCTILRNIRICSLRFVASLLAAGMACPVLIAAPARPAAAAPPAPAPGGTTQTIVAQPGQGMFESNTFLQLMDRAFDTQSDSFDPEQGEMRWKGRTFQIGNNRVFKARFERYLNLPTGAVDQHREYQGLLEEIFDRLSTRHRVTTEDNLNEAWLMLFDAAAYEADAGNSVVIANLVYNSWRIRDEHRANQTARTNLARDRQELRHVVVSREKALLEMAEERLREGKLRMGQASHGADLPYRQQEVAEVEATIKALEGQSTLTAQQAKLQFQSQILSFFFQRRFQHALISTSFYRAIFKGTAQNLEVGQKEMKDFMPDSDLVPSIETLEFLAREAVADVISGMAAVETAYAENRLVSSLQRLQETFFLGEHLLPVLRFEYEKRQRILRTYQQMEEANKLADLKDFDEVERLARELAKNAVDFRVSEVLSAVRSVKQMSNLALFSAQQAVAAGDFVRAEEGLERSSRIWPLNPALDNFTRQISSRVDISALAASSFDDQYSRGQYRQIFDRRNDLLPGVFGDDERSEKMRRVMDNVGRIDMLMAQSREMIAQENAFGAWEMLAAATEIDPDDVVLNREKAQLAPRVAVFAGLLDTAMRHERDGNYAVSLSQYLKVRDMYPASRLARQGIERVGERLMNELSQAPARPAAGNDF